MNTNMAYNKSSMKMVIYYLKTFILMELVTAYNNSSMKMVI